MAKPPVKRPLLPKDDRNRLRAMADKAEQQTGEDSGNRAYARAVVDTLRWLTGDDMTMSALLEEVTR